MIYKGKNAIGAIYYGRKIISAVYKGALLVWQSIRSCFGSGSWLNDKPFINEESWKNK